METRANYVLVGTFVLVIIAAVFGATLWLAGAEFSRSFANYDIYFDGSVTGLSEGAPVRYSGVPIGRVTGIHLDPQYPEQVKVTIEVDTATPIKSDAVASLEMQGITGVGYVEISGGSRDAPPLVPLGNQRYPVIASKPSGFESVVASAPEAVSRLIAVADRLNDLLNEKNRAAISGTLQNVQQITAAGVKDMQRVDAILDDTDLALKEFRVTLTTANGALGEVQKTIASINGLTGDLGQAIKALNTTAQNLNTLVVDASPGVSSFSQTGLSEIQQLVSDTRVLVASLTRLSDEIERDPTRFIFGERREGYRPR